MNVIQYRIRLDVSKADNQSEIVVKQNDTRTRTVRAYLSNGAEAYEISEGVTAVVRGKKPSGTILYNSCTIDGNFVVFDITNQMIAEPGRVECELTLTGSGGEVLTSPSFLLFVDEKIYSDSEIESKDEFTELQKLEAAEIVRVAAEKERVSAETERETAETARQTAEISRESAEISRETAENERINAENARISAEKLRESAELERDSAEAIRTASETARVAAENARITAESARKTAETARTSAETTRESAEASRTSAEDSRKAAEQKREQAESERIKAESARAAAETKRAAAWGNASASATTGESGTSASAEASLTDSGVKFTFSIPRGDKGARGDDFTILGYYETLDALKAAVPHPAAGAAYGVGAAYPYDIYIYDGVTGTWVNNGSIQGPKGDAATITVGTVTTGEAGTDAKVVNSGTENAAVLDFTIPKGDKGDSAPMTHASQHAATGTDPVTPAAIGAATAIHASQHKSGGTDSIAPSDIGAASSVHASQHAIGGSDPVTPTAIGAASTSHNSTHKTGGSDALAPSDIGAASSVHASNHASGGSDPITPSLIGAAVPSASVSATLETWTDNTCTVAVSGVTASNNIVVSLGTTTADEFAAAVAAQLHCTAQGADSITVTAFGTVPSISLPINVLIVG